MASSVEQPQIVVLLTAQHFLFFSTNILISFWVQEEKKYKKK